MAGDPNDYRFSPALSAPTAGGKLNLINTLPADERYGYLYEGNSQVLDHVVVSRGACDVDYDVVHVNSVFATQAGDNDPQLVRLRPRP